MAARGQTERLGVNAVEKVFLDGEWLFREQTVSDWGVDAHAEPTENGEPVGKLVALQIKAGPSYFVEKGDGFIYRGTKRHLDYWLRHSLPVYIILHNPEDGLTLWQKVEKHLVTIRASGRWSIQIPKSNLLTQDALLHIKRNTSSDPNSFRRYLLALDYPVMQKFVRRKAYMRVMEFYTKSLNMRGAWVRFTDENKPEVDLEIPRWMPHSSIQEYMAELFPWLDYEHTKPLLYPLGDTEGEMHELKVSLNEIGKSFLVLERYYEEGPPEKNYEVPFDTSDQMDDDEYEEWAYRRAMERD